MRSDERFDRAAGKRLTGTLTNPNVKVPDQNGLPPAFSSSGSCVLCLVLGSAFLLLQCSDALRERCVETARLAFGLCGLQARRASFRFAFNKLHHARAILV